MKKLIAVALLLSGCASREHLILPDGSAGYEITCSGSCFAEAGRVCRNGYDLLRLDTRLGWTMLNVNYDSNAATREMLVRCR